MADGVGVMDGSRGSAVKAVKMERVVDGDGTECDAVEMEGAKLCRDGISHRREAEHLKNSPLSFAIEDNDTKGGIQYPSCVNTSVSSWVHNAKSSSNAFACLALPSARAGTSRTISTSFTFFLKSWVLLLSVWTFISSDNRVLIPSE